MSQARAKSYHLRIKSAGDPSAEQLAKINGYALAELTAEQVYVRSFVLAHNGIDRDEEFFTDSALADFARTLPGKGLFIKHPAGWDGDSGPGKGRWFDAQLEHLPLDEARKLLREPALQWPPGINTATLLIASAYMVRTASNEDLRSEIDAGIVADVSIGFTAKRGDNAHDEAGRELSARGLTSPAEALEGSLVWLGAQPGARAIKGANRNHIQEEDDVETIEQLKAANTQLDNDLKAAAPARDIVVKAREALGDDGHLIEKPEVLAAHVKAGKAFRDEMIDGIVAAERHLGLCGDSEEAVKAAKAIYAGESFERLETLVKHYAARMPSGTQLAPSDPNTVKAKSAVNPAEDKSVPAVFARAPLL